MPQNMVGEREAWGTPGGPFPCRVSREADNCCVRLSWHPARQLHLTPTLLLKRSYTDSYVPPIRTSNVSGIHSGAQTRVCLFSCQALF